MATYASKVDAALSAGNYLSRQKVGGVAVQKLRDLKHFNPNVPWAFASVPFCNIYPTSTSLETGIRHRVDCASSVDEDNQWRSFFWDGRDWQEIYPLRDDQPTILVAAMLNEREKAKGEIHSLRRELSQLRLENEVLRHEVVRCQPPPSRPISKAVLVCFAILLASLLFGSAQAVDTYYTTRSMTLREMDDFNQDLDTFIQQALLKNYTHSVTETIGHHLVTNGYTVIEIYKARVRDFFFQNTREETRAFAGYVYGCLAGYFWEILTFCLGVATIAKAEHKITSMLYLVIATLSRARFAALAIAPIHTLTSAWVFMILTLAYRFEPLVCLALASAQLVISIGAAAVMDSATFIQHVRAHVVTALMLPVLHFFYTFNINTDMLGACIVLYRVLMLIPSPGTATIELRDQDGKVTKKISLAKNTLFKFTQGLRRMMQVRTTVTPMVRVQPNALVHVQASNSRGTGFFCGQYCVTAGHVVGNETAVKICYGGKQYDTTVVRHVPNKDICLLKMPAALTSVPRYKVAKTICADWVCVIAPEGEGAYVTTTTPGHVTSDTISYATPTRDGMSGAPVCDTNGHVIGVHQTNTGYTGGAVILRHEEINEPPKESEVTLLRAQVAELKKLLEAPKNPLVQQKPAQVTIPQTPSAPVPAPRKNAPMQQCVLQEADIVNLVRAAVGREIQVIRSELDCLQAKGKTKRGRGRKHLLRVAGGQRRKRRGAMFTEQEYKELLEEGYTKEELQAIAEEIYERRLEEQEQEEAEAGYPNWEDPDDDYDPDDDWNFMDETDEEYFRRKEEEDARFEPYGDDRYGDGEGNGYHQLSVSKNFKPEKLEAKSYTRGAVDVTCLKQALQDVAPVDKRVCRRELNAIVNAILSGKDPTLQVYTFDRKAASLGMPTLLPTCQRVKPKHVPQSKNGKAGPKGPATKA